jgi:threonine dehydrogenase-like Zn-dependent dehydrogenase
VRQLTMTEDRRVEWWDVPEPRLQEARDALVRPVAVAACDLDARIISGEAPLPGPVALGHELVAEVVDVGDAAAAAGVTPGDTTVVPFQISCGDCARCKAGQTGMCETVPRHSMYGFGPFGGAWGGALSDLLRVPFADHMLVPLPEGIDPVSVASASDNLPDAWRTVAPVVKPGDKVLIAGGGGVSIALFAVAIAKALGASRVDYLDDDPGRLALAAELGAEPMPAPPDGPIGPYEVTVDASANPERLATALRSTGPCGTCTSVGIYWQNDTPLPLLEMYDRAVTFTTGSPQARPAIPEVLELVAAGKLEPERITTRVVSFGEAPEALTERYTKLVMVPD